MDIKKGAVNMKYCPYCKQMVNPQKKINWIIFLILFLLAGFPGLIYLVYCLLFKSPQCPMCGSKNFLDTPNGNKKDLNDYVRDSITSAAKKGIKQIRK